MYSDLVNCEWIDSFVIEFCCWSGYFDVLSEDASHPELAFPLPLLQTSLATQSSSQRFTSIRPETLKIQKAPISIDQANNKLIMDNNQVAQAPRRDPFTSPTDPRTARIGFGSI
jgi:hypothetical protein